MGSRPRRAAQSDARAASRKRSNRSSTTEREATAWPLPLRAGEKRRRRTQWRAAPAKPWPPGASPTISAVRGCPDRATSMATSTVPLSLRAAYGNRSAQEPLPPSKRAADPPRRSAAERVAVPPPLASSPEAEAPAARWPELPALSASFAPAPGPPVSSEGGGDGRGVAVGKLAAAGEPVGGDGREALRVAAAVRRSDADGRGSFAACCGAGEPTRSEVSRSSASSTQIRAGGAVFAGPVGARASRHQPATPWRRSAVVALQHQR